MQAKAASLVGLDPETVRMFLGLTPTLTEKNPRMHSAVLVYKANVWSFKAVCGGGVGPNPLFLLSVTFYY